MGEVRQRQGWKQTGSGTSIATGPASSTDNALARYDGTGGDTLQDSLIVVDDSGNVTGVVSLTATTLVTSGNIELGNASDTTLSRTGAGAIAVEGVGVALNSTSLVHTASTIELGAASDTTFSRVSAGVAAIEGNNIITKNINPWITVFKTSDETLTGGSSTTLQNDDALLFAVLANTKYQFRARIYMNTPTAADFKSQWTGPASPTLVRVATRCWNASATDPTTFMDTAFSTVNAFTFSVPTDFMHEVDGVIQNGTNAGTVQLQWAQNSSSGTTTVYAGSYLEYAVVA